MLTAWTTVMAIGHYDPSLLVPGSVASPTFAPEAIEDSAPPPSVGSRVNPVRVSQGDVIVVAESDVFFTPDGASAIRDAVEALQSLPQVDGVFWMDDAPPLNLFGLPEPILPGRNASANRYADAKERALAHPLVAGQLLSRDTKTLLLMVTIDWLFVTADTDTTDRLREVASRAAAKYDGVDMRFRVTGEVPIRISRASSTRSNERKYQAIGYSIALAIAFVLFRGLSSVFIVALAPTMGVFWTIGLLHYLGLDGNPFNSVIVPVLLCMVGFTDGVHMMVQIRRHRAGGLSATDAARRSIREVGMACWLTSLTTAIGFGSLALAHHEVVREFGLCCVIGVTMTFVSVITVIPLACASPLGRRVHTAERMSMLELLPPPLKQAYYVPVDRTSLVRFRLQDLGIATYGPVFERVEKRVVEIASQHPEFSIELRGSAVNRWKNLYQIVVDLAISLGTASIIIFVVLSIVYRSLRLGLISIVPNIFPLAATGAIMWTVGQSLEIVSVCAFTVCLGIAVDDTIHFLTRYQEELSKDGGSLDISAAIRRAFIGVGTALVMTTIVLIVGFATALLSDARDHRIFAMMGILTIGGALFADLVFLPALLVRFARPKDPQDA